MKTTPGVTRVKLGPGLNFTKMEKFRPGPNFVLSSL
jgi:hypothetical protein